MYLHPVPGAVSCMQPGHLLTQQHSLERATSHHLFLKRFSIHTVTLHTRRQFTVSHRRISTPNDGASQVHVFCAYPRGASHFASRTESGPVAQQGADPAKICDSIHPAVPRTAISSAARTVSLPHSLLKASVRIFYASTFRLVSRGLTWAAH